MKFDDIKNWLTDWLRGWDRRLALLIGAAIVMLAWRAVEQSSFIWETKGSRDATVFAVRIPENTSKLELTALEDRQIKFMIATKKNVARAWLQKRALDNSEKKEIAGCETQESTSIDGVSCKLDEANHTLVISIGKTSTSSRDIWVVPYRTVNTDRFGVSPVQWKHVKWQPIGQDSPNQVDASTCGTSAQSNICMIAEDILRDLTLQRADSPERNIARWARAATKFAIPTVIQVMIYVVYALSLERQTG